MTSSETVSAWLIAQPPGAAVRSLGDISRQLEFQRLRVAVAYASELGVHALREELSSHPNWQSSMKHFLVSIDHGLTQPEALDRLRNLKRAEVRIPAADEVIARTHMRRTEVFHPKAFVFDTGMPIAPAGLVIGSSNLTQAGLRSNAELGVCILLPSHSVPSGIGRSFDRWWGQQWAASSALTTDLLHRYGEARKLLRRAVPDSFLSEEPSPSELAAASSLWIEAGFLSGGSQNQLELPQGAEAFFGLESSPRNRTTFTLQIEATSWGSWLQFWQNGVWRLRLPTITESAKSFQGSVIRLDRTSESGVFRLKSAGVHTSAARRWRERSDRQGTRRTTQQGSTGRAYGWF